MEFYVPKYGPGFTFAWEPLYVIKCRLEGDSAVIEANRAGLISLARHLLELADEDAKEYTHFHLDQCNSLEKDSAEIIVVKRDFA